MYVSLESGQGEQQNDTTGPLPVDSRDFYIQSYKGFNYYLIDLNNVKWSSLGNIIQGCEAVENECWKAQEEFSTYLRKCDVLSYAEKDGRIVAFDAVAILNSGSYCVYNNEETMVLREFRGRDLARRLVIMTVEWHLTKTASMKKKDYFIFTSISANPAVVNRYFNKSWLRRLFDSSFAPSPRLIALKDEYCRKYGIELVDKRYPFCLKNMFPGSNSFDPKDPKYQFSSHVRANMPPEFEHMVRGDAFAFMLMIPMKIVRWVTFILMIKCFGVEYFSSRGVGLFSGSRPLIPSTLEGRIPDLSGERLSVKTADPG
jgi:GNAT superfamily N-acetyltransferase